MDNHSVQPIAEVLPLGRQSTPTDRLHALFSSIAYVAEYGEPLAEGHLRRVAVYTTFLAQDVMGWAEREASQLASAALLHDVGKVAVPTQILVKPSTLTPQERLVMQAHVTCGYDLLQRVEANFAHMGTDWTLFQWAKEVARSHHENWDGSGYPDGLQREDIPVSARIVKLADVIDALLSPRPYKQPWPWRQIRRELLRLAGVEFEPRLVGRLLQKEREFLEHVNAVQGAELGTVDRP